LKSFSAGQPIFLCLQYLQAREPLIIAFPIDDNKNNKITNINRVKLNLIIKSIIPTTIGIKETRKSKNRLFQETLILLKDLGLPFLKSSEHNLPLPKAHFLP
jgi:hypothetical protein